jgi:hypothetical protein
MAEASKESPDHELFVTEFPKKGFGIVDYLQGRMHFALMDQMKLMNKSGMKQEQIKDAIINQKVLDSICVDSIIIIL